MDTAWEMVSTQEIRDKFKQVITKKSPKVNIVFSAWSNKKVKVKSKFIYFLINIPKMPFRPINV